MRPREPHSSTTLCRSPSSRGTYASTWDTSVQGSTAHPFRAGVTRRESSPPVHTGPRPPTALLPALSYLLPSGADQSLSYPIRDADPRQLCRLAYQLLVLGCDADVQGGGVSAFGFLCGLAHA